MAESEESIDGMPKKSMTALEQLRVGGDPGFVQRWVKNDELLKLLIEAVLELEDRVAGRC